MHVLLLGATGRTGRHVLHLALEEGHRVTALVRREGALDPAEGLDVRVGDATDASALAEALDGVDAIVDTTGPVKGAPADVRRRIADALVAATAGRDGLRLVGLTGAGARRPEDEPGLVDRLVVGVMRVVARDQLEDGTAYLERLLAADHLDVVVVRAPRLVDGRGGRDVALTAGTGPGAGVLLDREDLAAEMLSLAAGVTSAPTRTPVLSSP